MPSLHDLLCDIKPDNAALPELEAVLALLKSSSDAQEELSESIGEHWDTLVAAAAAVVGPAGAAVLGGAADACSPREVFTLASATLSSSIRAQAKPPAGQQGCSPGFQLFLLALLARCLLRIKRKWLRFLALWVDSLLRWSGQVLPELPAGQLPPIDHGTVAAMPLPTSPPEPCTAGSAMAVVAACVQQLSEFAGDGRSGMGEDEQRAALALLAQAVLQLASRTLQMPATLAALNLQLGRAMGEWPRFGKKLMGLLPVASAAVAWPSSLLTLLPALRITSLEQLLTIAEEDLGNSERGSAAAAAASEVGFLSACEVAEGAAVAACSAALATADAASRPATWHLLAPQLGGSSSQQLMLHLLTAAPLLMDIAAAQQSVPLMLVPLAALWAASRQLAVQQRQDLAEAPPGVLALLGSLVTVMCCNPVELVRSCTHEALQAVLYSLAPPARMGALQHLLQMPESTAAVVSLQRLRQEVAASCGTDGQAGSVFLTPATVQAALVWLERGGAGGWQAEEDVMLRADAMAAALSLLRFILLREAARPLGLLDPRAMRSVLAQDLQPLQACLGRLLEAHHVAGVGELNKGRIDIPREAVEGLMGLQRLQEVLGRVVALIQQQD